MPRNCRRPGAPGNGILTIARGTLPLAIFGPENYAYRPGLIGAQSRIAQALAPVLIGLLIDPFGKGVVAVTASLSVAALAALLLLQARLKSADLAPASWFFRAAETARSARTPGLP
jgi:hypothetical protein